MRMFASIILASLISIIGCERNDYCSLESILGFWEVIEMVEEEASIMKETKTDSIIIEFQSNQLIIGNSSRNLLTGRYQLYTNDSIWISTIGGTEINNTNWEKKFREIMPKMKFCECDGNLELVLFSINRKSHILFNKHNEL